MQRRKRKERGVENPTTPTRVSPREKAENQGSEPTGTPEELQVTPRKPHRDYTRKRAKPSNIVTNALDGMQFDAADDDDMLLPDIKISCPSKGRRYVKDDIVWARRNAMYWPALVTSVKWPSVCYLFVNEKGKDVYKTHAKNLISFDNAAKNLELKEQGMKKYTDFVEAYDLVVQFLCKRKQNADINALRFLSSSASSDDIISQAKDCLLRLAGVWDTNTFPSVENCGDGDGACNDKEKEDDGPQQSA